MQAQRSAWQRKLLPLMGGILVLAAVFFAGMSIFELREFYSKVTHAPFDLEAKYKAYESSASPDVLNDPAYIRFKVLSLLEADALQRRYHQANATMLARVWTRQLGFITGMLIALVGAAFILGRLQEETTTLEVASDKLKGALATSSPGIVLAVLGTALMALTIWIPFGVETRDVNTYLQNPPALRLPPPGSFLPQEKATEETSPGQKTQDQAGQQAPKDAEEQRLFGTPGAGTPTTSTPTKGGGN